MLPNKTYIDIFDNKSRIIQFLREIIIEPKHKLRNWSAITNQTPAAKIGYVGQHLASLITGVKGTGSGARGDDLRDGSEVKSCNKVDQVDTCKNCGKRVLRAMESCPYCGSTDIIRKEDSKWLFSVRSQDELDQYLNIERLVLILMDYPKFDLQDFKDIRITAFEIYPKERRMQVFNGLIKNHYYNIYRRKADSGEKTNPMNLHPWSFQFYKCNPIKIFECVINNVDSENASIDILSYIQPLQERGVEVATLPMPTHLLNKVEWDYLLENVDYSDLRKFLKHDVLKGNFTRMSLKEKSAILPYIDEETRNVLPLREIKSISQKTTYHRS